MTTYLVNADRAPFVIGRYRGFIAHSKNALPKIFCIQWVLSYTRFGLHGFSYTRLRKIIIKKKKKKKNGSIYDADHSYTRFSVAHKWNSLFIGHYQEPNPAYNLEPPVHCVILRRHFIAIQWGGCLHNALNIAIKVVNHIKSNSLWDCLFHQFCSQNGEELEYLVIHTKIRLY